MFIIKRQSILRIKQAIKYMSLFPCTSDLFGKHWQHIQTPATFNIFQNFSIMIFQSYQDAEIFITLHGLPQEEFAAWLLVRNIYICELNNNGDIIKETKYNNSATIINQPSDGTIDIDDGIDYSTPGEALKAHKAGKYVNWKRLANKH